MASFSEADKALIREIAFEVGDVLSKRWDKQMEQHMNTCPTSKRVNRFIWFVLGALVAGGVAGLGLDGVVRLIRAM